MKQRFTTSGTAGHKRDSHGTVPLTVSGTDRTHPLGGVPLSQLSAKLAKIDCLLELEGFANRRRYVPWLPKWTEEERGLIMARKYELERKHGKK